MSLSIALALLSTGCASGASPGAAGSTTHRSPTSTTSPTRTSTKFPTPAYNGHNGVVASADSNAWYVNASLKDWKTKPDFIAEATVTDQTLLPATTPETNPENWNTLRTVTIDHVVWQRHDGVAAPDTVKLIGWGWSRNNDTGKVSALLPDDGPRLDVGDHFVAAFSNDTNRFSGAYLTSASYTSMPTHWAIFGSPGALLVKDGKIVTDDHTADYEKPFTGLTVDDFAQKLAQVE